MLTEQPCTCGPKRPHCRFLTEAELEMEIMDPRLTASRYHEIMNLFEDAFDRTEDRAWNSKQASTDQEAR